MNRVGLGEPYEGQKFASFDVLKKYLEEYGRKNYVKLWTRSSHTINSLKSKTRKINPDLKYACMKFACIFGGEKSRCRGSGIRKSTTYRNLGCPFTISAVIGEDGNHVKLETVNLDHNHSLGKTLYDSLKKSKNKMKILQNEMDNCESAKRRLLNRNSQMRTEEDTDPNDNAPFNHVEVLRSHRNNKGMVKTDNAMSAKLEASEEFQVCLKEIQAKYGSNIKIIVVHKEEPEQAEEETPHQEIYETDISQLRRELEKSEQIKNLRFSRICRLCLSSSNKLNPIFDPNQPLESTILSFKIMSCASIEVSRNDGLPANICTACEETLEHAYNFRIRSENADTVLRKSHPISEYIGVNEIPLLSPADLEEIEPYEEMESFDEPEERMAYPSVPNERTAPLLNRYKHIIISRGRQVRPRFQDACPFCERSFREYAQLVRHIDEHNNIRNFLLSCNFCLAVFSTVNTLVDHLNDHLIANALRGEPRASLRYNLFPEEEEEEEVEEVEVVELVEVEEEGQELEEAAQEVEEEEQEAEEEEQEVEEEQEAEEEEQEVEEEQEEDEDEQEEEQEEDEDEQEEDEDEQEEEEDEEEQEEDEDEEEEEVEEPEEETPQVEEPPVPESQPERSLDSGFLCNVCGKILRSKDRFQSHKNTHEGLRPHICIKCGRGFADRKNMHQHYDIVHLRKAKHECPVCHKKFYAPTKMKSHVTMHYGLKPFSCDICNKTFRLRMNMIKHKKTHSNERPHKCDKCKAAFIDKNLLTRHSYVHGGIRPHVCPDCGHRFTLKFNLKKHVTGGRCNGKKDNDNEFGWETVHFEAPLPDDRDDQSDLVEELLQELGAKP